MSSDFQQRIPGDPADEIHYHFFQVFTHVLLLHFDTIFMNFHGQIRFLDQPKMGAAAHMEIEFFSMYRARHMRKMPSNPRTYAAVLKTVAYEAAHMVFSIN